MEIIKPEKNFITKKDKNSLKKYFHIDNFPLERSGEGKNIKMSFFEKEAHFLVYKHFIKYQNLTINF